MKNSNFSPVLKRRLAAIAAFIIVFSAAIVFVFKKPEEKKLFASDGEYYDIVRDYMQAHYIEVYSEYFEVAYVEALSDYKECYDDNTNALEAEFVMNTYYKYPYRDPDTMPNVIAARENGDMKEYKRLYDECNTPKVADYKLKIEATVKDGALDDVRLYSGTEDEEWVFLENGLKEYIMEE